MDPRGQDLPEPLRSLSRTRLARASFGIAAVALLCLGVARVPLEGAPQLEALGAELAARTGAEIHFGAVRVDPLGAGGVVVEDLVVRGAQWRLLLPRAVWRPRLGGLLDGGLGAGVLGARGFELVVDEDIGRFDPAQLLPNLELRLRAGTLRVVESFGAPGAGLALLENLRIEVRQSPDGPRFELRGSQPGGGRIDLRARRDGDAVEVDLFPEALGLGPLEARIAGALPEGLRELRGLRIGGHWRFRSQWEERAAHRFGLELRAAGGDARPALDLRLRGRFAITRGGRAPVVEAGSSVTLSGELRLAGSGLGTAGRVLDAPFFVAGPVEARLAVSGPLDRPRARGSVSLREAHVRVGSQIRKPCGVAAELRLDSEPGLSPADGGRRTRLDLALGGLALSARSHGDGPFEGSSDWVALTDVASWLVPAEDRASGGRVRIRELRFASVADFEAALELDAVALTGRRSPLPLANLRGAGRVDPGGLRAHGLTAELLGVPLRVDLAARFPAPGEPARLRFLARAEELDLDALGLAGDPDSGALAGGPLPGALVAAAESPVLRLHGQRDRLARLEVETGRLEVGRMRTGGQVLRNLEIDLALRSLRLDVSRVAFRHLGAASRYSGSIDFNPLVPAVAFVAGP